MKTPSFRFGVFEVDLAARELRKSGVRVKLQDQPFRVLALLLERPGEIVTREELRQAIWSEDTFVEFDAGLNTAIQKIRQALGDSASSPRFLETIPRRGYRFVAPVEGATPRPNAGEEPRTEAMSAGRGKRRELIAVGTLLVLAVAGWLVFSAARRFTKTSPSPLSAVPLTTYPGTETAPSFSPDGNQVAFSWDGPDQDNVDVYVKVVGPGEPLRLTTDPARDSSPAWSPDGRFIAFVRWHHPSPRGDVMLVPALGGAERKVGTTSFHPITIFQPCLAWSADSKWLAVPDYTSVGEPISLFLLSLETGEKRRLTTAEAGNDYYPAFSPDGRSLVFTRNRNIHALALSEDLAPAGKPRPLMFFEGGLAIIKPSWTADGREVIYARGRNLWRVSASGSAKLQPLAIPGAAGTWPATSPQGNRLAYVHVLGDINIWRAEAAREGGNPAPPSKLIASTQRDSSMDYSPDGKKIAFSSTRSGSQEIWMANSDGTSPVQMTFFHGFAVGSPRWSPDGQWIAFDTTVEGGDIFIVSAQGGKPRRFTEHAAYDAVATWSRDGGWIYFYSRRGGSDQIWKKPAAGGEATQVTKNGGNQAFESADGESVYFVKRDAPGLWKIPREGGEEALILEGVRFLRFYVNSEGVYFHHLDDPNRPETGSIRFYNFASEQVRTIVSLNKPADGGLTVSPDGRWVLYSQRDQQGRDLMLVEGFE